jgi:signal transduction histidine kinase
MPQMDGYELLRNVRKTGQTALIPFIFLTGRADVKQVRSGMQLGADDYLTKPFSIEDLIATVRARLQKKKTLENHVEERLEELRKNISLALPHEFRTPLTGILTCAEILRLEGDALQPGDHAKLAGMLQNSASRLHRLLEDFLLYAQLEMLVSNPDATNELLSLPPLPYHAIVEEVVRDCAEHWERGADLVFRLDSGTIAVSENHLRKIVLELADNACKFSRKGTPVEVESLHGLHETRIAVGDQGRGMTTEQIRHIGAFNQFNREIFEQQGAGMGLAIVKRLMDLYGGAVSIESNPGKKTSVAIVVPNRKKS